MSSKNDRSLSNSTNSNSGGGGGGVKWKSFKRSSTRGKSSSVSSSTSSWQNQLSFKVKGGGGSSKEDQQGLLRASPTSSSGSINTSSIAPPPAPPVLAAKPPTKKKDVPKGGGMSRDKNSTTNNNNKGGEKDVAQQAVDNLTNFFRTANTVDKMSHSMHGTGTSKQKKLQSGGGGLSRHSTHGTSPTRSSSNNNKSLEKNTGGKKSSLSPKESAIQKSSITSSKDKKKETAPSTTNKIEKLSTNPKDEKQSTNTTAPIKLITQLQSQNKSHERTNAALNAQIELLKKQMKTQKDQHEDAMKRMQNEQEEVNLKLSVLEKHFCELNTAGDASSSGITAGESQMSSKENVPNENGTKASSSSNNNNNIPQVKSIVQLDAAYVTDLETQAKTSNERITNLQNELSTLKQQSLEKEALLQDEVEDLSMKLKVREDTVKNLEVNLTQLREARFQSGGVGGGLASPVPGGHHHHHHNRRHRRFHSTNSGATTTPRRTHHRNISHTPVGVGGVGVGGMDDDDASVVSYAESVASMGDASIMSALNAPPAAVLPQPNKAGGTTSTTTSEEDIAKAVTEAVKAAIVKRDEEFKGKVERLRERTRQRLASRENKIARLERKVMVLEKNLSELQQQQESGGGVGGGLHENGGGAAVTAAATLAAQERPMLLNLRTLSVTSEMMDGSIHRLENMMNLFNSNTENNDKATVIKTAAGSEKEEILSLAQKLSLLQEELRVSIQLLDQRTKNRLEALRSAAEDEERMKVEVFQEGKKTDEIKEEEEEDNEGEKEGNAQTGQSSGEGGAEQEKATPSPETAADASSSASTNDSKEDTTTTKTEQRKYNQQEQQEILQYQQSIADLINEVHNETKESLHKTEVTVSKKLGSLKEQIRINQFDLDAKRDIIESLEIACAENDRNVRALTNELNDLKEKEYRRDQMEKKREEEEGRQVEKDEKMRGGGGEKDEKGDGLQIETALSKEEPTSPSSRDDRKKRRASTTEVSDTSGSVSPRRSMSGVWRRGGNRSPKRNNN